MSRVRTLLVFPLALLSACAPYNVRYDYDVTQDFSAYRTFDLYAPGRHGRAQGQGDEASLMDKRVRAAVAAELQSRGFSREETADPDFLVACYPIYRTRHYRTTTHVGFGGGWYRPWGYRVGTSFSQVHSYREGTLVIEIVDRRTNQLVWSGSAEGALTDQEDPVEANAQVARAVKDVLEKFPPRAR
ncbi:MAG TPA: DUF4136 domain-containing protein [Holophagaceae bacterium]|nr:DUF4136 domain-containing protein [Holophagaceae bacterium]